VGLEDEVSVCWDYFYNYTTGPAMTAFAPLVVYERLVKWNERIGRAQTGMLKWLMVDGHASCSAQARGTIARVL